MVGNEINNPNTNVEIGNDLKQDINKINSLKLDEKNGGLELSCIEPVPKEHVKFEGLDDNDSIFSDETDDKLPPIPDGGWGWVVVFAAFLTSACADGLAYSFGILHEEFTNYFDESQSKTSLIGSLFISIPLISGPIMSALVDRFGCRMMTIIAGVLSTIGFLLASQSNSVGMLCVTLGVMSGLAMGILYVTSVVSVAFWFDKRRTLAVSLASCGIGFGTLVYSPMTNFFIELYDWRNTLVLLAGTLMNMCVCGALMRDPDWLIVKENREKKQAKARSRKSSSAGSISSKSIGGESVYLTSEELNDLLKSGKSPEYILATLTSTLAVAEQLEVTTQMNAEQSYKRINSDVHLPTYLQQNEKVPAEVIEKLMTNKSLYNILVHNYPHVINRRKSDIELPINIKEPVSLQVTVLAEKPKYNKINERNNAQKENSAICNNEMKAIEDKPKNGINNEKKAVEDKSKNGINNEKKAVEDKSKNAANNVVKAIEDKPKNAKDEKPTTTNAVRKDQHTKVIQQTRWLTRQLYTDHRYLRNMPLNRNTMMHRGAMMNIPRYKLRASSLPDIYRNSTWSLSDADEEKRWYHRIINACFKSIFDIRMFTEFHFLMFNIGSLILSIWAIIPYFFLKSYMTSQDIDGGALMISIIGISSGVGIIALGWAGDQPWMNVTKAYAVCLFICGLSVGAYPLFITNYWALAVISTVFGLSYASSYSYTPAILMELLPINYFTTGYGFILLSQGIGHLIGPPLGGLFFDVTQSWDLTFYAGGVWLVVAGGCVGVIPYTRNVRMCGTRPLLKDAEEAESKHSIDV